MISIADNFLYQGRKSLDSRIVKDTIADMVTMNESIIYDGIMVYNKETEKFYVFKSTNEVDPILAKWREFEAGSAKSSSVTEYEQGAAIKKSTLIIYEGKLYVSTLDFSADDTEATLAESLQKDIDAGNLVPVDTDKDTHSFEYTVGTDYKKGYLLVKDEKLYLVANDFTATDFDTEITNKDLLPVNVDTDTDTHAYEYTIGEDYKTNNLLIRNEKVYLVLNNFTATDFNTELANKYFIPVDSDTDTHSVAYIQNGEYSKGNLIVYNDELYIALDDFTSDNTEATVEDSFNTDLTNNKIKPVNIDVDTHTYEYTSNTKYSKGQLLVYQEKLYLILKDFTSDNTGTTLSDNFKIDYDAKNIVEVDTDIYNEPIREFQFGTEYAKHTLLTFNDELCLTLDDYTSAAFYDDLANEKIMKVSVCSKEYTQNGYYLTNDLVFLGNKLARVRTNYWSDDTKATIEESFQYDIDKNELILISSGSGDATLTEDVTSNLVVGNIKYGDSFAVGTTFTEFVKKLLIKEILPTVVLDAQNSGLKLLGTTVSTPTISINITLGSGTIQKVEFYRGTTLEETQNYVDGTNSYIYNTSDINADTKITAKVYYIESDGVTVGTINKEASYKFMNYSYSGVLGEIPTDADVLTLTTNLKDTKAYTQTYTVNDEHIIYAYPASLGNLTSIKDQNNFEYIGSFTKISKVINGENYNIYYLTDKITADGITMKFN